MYNNINTFIIDVRDEIEHLSSNDYIINNTINIPLNILPNIITKFGLPKDMDIIVFCESGHRSKIAKIILTDMGYNNVIDIGSYKNIIM